jgi:hypothetical protein
MISPSRIATFALITLTGFSIRAEGTTRKLADKGAAVRVGAIHAPNHSARQTATLGFELGYASPVFPFENMSFTWGHLSRNELEHNYFLLNFEDSYPLSADRLALYGSSGIGAILLDQKPGPDKTAAVGRLAVGLRQTLSNTLALFAEANFMISYENMWVDGTSLENRHWQYVAGIQYRF